MHRTGETVVLHGRVGVGVLLGRDLGQGLGDHTGVWFGTSEDDRPEVWTVPTGYLTPGPPPALRH